MGVNDFLWRSEKGAVIHIKDTDQLTMRQKTRKAENHSGQG